MHSDTDVILWNISLALLAGTFSFYISKKINLAPIVFFIFIGILLGPNFLGILNPSDLGASLKSFVFFGVAIILFEGGLTLDYSGYKKVSKTIIYLLTFGVIVTWLLNALFIYYVFNFRFLFSLFCSSLIIVTGPTVITPILKRVNVSKRVFNILHWEGVLIDPIGVFLTILCFEIVVSEGRGAGEAISFLFLRLGSGLIVGSVIGLISVYLINKKWVPADLTNAFTLTIALITFLICDTIASESGLLGVVVCGLLIGIKRNFIIEDIKKFKLEITEILVGIIFILLSANLNLENLNNFGYRGILLISLIILITRPLSVFLSTLKSNLKFNEKLFISWIAPRGIIVASTSSLFYITLSGYPNFSNEVWFVETFTYSIILTTVLSQGLSAGFVSRLLGLDQEELKEWIIIGIHELSIRISDYLKEINQEVILIDSNYNQVNYYKKKGYKCIYLNALSHEIHNNQLFFYSSYLIALTDNIELNVLICQHWKVIISKNNLYRWGRVEEKQKEQSLVGKVIWENLLKPSAISNKLNSEESDLVVLKNKKELKKKGNEVLFTYKGNSLNLSSELINNQEIENALVLIKKDRVFQNPIPKKVIVKRIFIKIDKILEEVSAEVTYKNPQFSKKEIYDKLINKVQKEPVCLGNRIALINISDSKIKKNYSALVQLKKEIDLNAYDGLKIKVIFIYINPIVDTLQYLKLITKLSKFINNSEIRENLINAKDKQDILKYINDLH